MAFQNMVAEATGIIPKMPPDFAKTLVNRARADAYRQNLWSFLMMEANWTSPAWITGGTVSVTQGVNTITFDPVVAKPLINAIASGGNQPSAVIARQFRIGVGTIYNIWAYNSSTGVATLDRNFQEPTAAAAQYMVFQCYYASPVKDFWQWIDIRDMVNWNPLRHTKKRSEIDLKDPQRTIYYIPTDVVPYQLDMNPASPTFQYPLFELWGVPTYVLTYQLYLLRKGADLVAPTDTLPPQIGEDCVMELVKRKCYEWAEANKSDERSMGSDYRFLMGAAEAEYKRLFREYRRTDRALVDNFRTKLETKCGFPNFYGWYSSIAGTASAGSPW